MSGKIASAPSLALVMLLLALPAPAHDLTPAPPQAGAVLLSGGDLYTVSGPVQRATDLLFEAGRITGIGKNLDVPAGARVLDVSGRRVYPGLIAPQTTLGLIEIGAVRATNDRSEVGQVTPEVAAHVAYNTDSELIPTVRSHGIAVAQVRPLGGLVSGRSMLVNLDGWTREDAAIRLLDGLQVNWPAMGEGGGDAEAREKRGKERVERLRLLESTFEQARAYAAARSANLDLPVDLRWEAMLPAVRGEMPVYIRADDRRQIERAVRFAGEAGLRMVLVGGKEAYAVTELLRKASIPVIVGNTTALPMRSDDDYDLPFRLPGLLHRAGVRFCLSHVSWGAWDVRNLAFQAGQAVAFGLPEDQALRSLTLSTAEILGLDDELGSLDVGKRATLFVSDGDVLDTLGQQVRHLFIDGREVDLGNRHKTLYRKYDGRPR